MTLIIDKVVIRGDFKARVFLLESNKSSPSSSLQSSIEVKYATVQIVPTAKALRLVSQRCRWPEVDPTRGSL